MINLSAINIPHKSNLFVVEPAKPHLFLPEGPINLLKLDPPFSFLQPPTSISYKVQRFFFFIDK